MKIFIAILSLMSMTSTGAASSLASQNQAPTSSSSTMTVYVYPPRHEINWSSPKNALLSFLGEYAEAYTVSNNDIKFTSDFHEEGDISSNYKSTMGHSIMHIQCDSFDKWVSFSGQDSTAVDKANSFDRKLGMGVLFYNYADGHLIVGPENWKRLVHYNGESTENEEGVYEKRKPRFIQFPITKQACADLNKMILFFESFHFPKGVDAVQLEKKDPESVLFFTNVIDPYVSYHQRMETGRGVVGGGCAPFAAALVKESGNYDPQFDQVWKRDLIVSKRLIGGEIDNRTGEKIEVNVKDLLFSDLGNHWVFEGYDNRSMRIYDPLLIWKFIGHVESCLSTRASKCDPEVLQWLRSTKAQPLLAPPQTFQDSFVKDVRYGRDGQTRKVKFNKSVVINGIRIQTEVN